MANVIRIRRRADPGSTGAPSSLYNAELAWNENDNTLYIGEGDSGGGIAATIIAIAGHGSFMTLGTPAQTITGDKTFQDLNFNPASATTTPFTIGANATGILVADLNSDLLDGEEGSFYQDAANLTAGVLADARVQETNVTQHEAALTILESQITDSTILARVASAEAITGLWTFNTALPTSSLTPTLDAEFTTKLYVDNKLRGIDWKESARAASDANVTTTYTNTGGTKSRGQHTACPDTLDGVSLAADDRILLKDQTGGSENGIWVVTTVGTGANGVWDRATDFDDDAEVTAGAANWVSEGTANEDTTWALATSDPIIIGGASGTVLVYAQLSGGTSITAGDGVSFTGSVLNVGGTASRISVSADNVDIDAAYVGQTSITTLGTVGTGTWAATVIGTTYGGLGVSHAATADDTLFKKTGGNPGTIAAATPEPVAGGGTGDYLDITSMVDGGTF